MKKQKNETKFGIVFHLEHETQVTAPIKIYCFHFDAAVSAAAVTDTNAVTFK